MTETALERFLRYAKIDTQSKDDSDTYPSTTKQFDLLNLLLKELKDYAKVDDATGKVSFLMEVAENGQILKKTLTAEQAVALLESKPAEFGPLFKSFASTGTGAKGNDHQFKDSKGRLSPEAISQLSMADYLKIRKENPAALGLV